MRLTSFRGPLVGSPSWSPDGRAIAFDSRPDGNADIYVVSSEGGQPRRLTTDAAEDVVPSWSHDGQWIYFASQRSGRLQIWKAPSQGGAAVQVTQGGGFDPLESPDGQWLYYTQERGSAAIWRVPVAGGTEQPVYDFRQRNYSRLWMIVSDGIYFAVTDSPNNFSIKLFDFASSSVKDVANIALALRSGVSGLAISPDGKWLLFPVVTQRGSDLMVIENFH
ncbi:MAG: DUF5050 domain-containing protein [Blastocatellia bacterium]